jgi:hypothetical protein
MSIASHIRFPNPRGTDLGDVARALEQAHALRNQGQLFEALKWLRHAANVAAEAGEDARAMELFKVAADVQAEIDRDADRSGPIRALSPRQPTARYGGPPQVLPAPPQAQPQPQPQPQPPQAQPQPQPQPQPPQAQPQPPPTRPAAPAARAAMDPEDDDEDETVETRQAVKLPATLQSRLAEAAGQPHEAAPAARQDGWDSMHDRETAPVDLGPLREELHARGIFTGSAAEHAPAQAVAAADLHPPHPFAATREDSSHAPASDASGARRRPDLQSQPTIDPSAPPHDSHSDPALPQPLAGAAGPDTLEDQRTLAIEGHPAAEEIADEHSLTLMSGGAGAIREAVADATRDSTLGAAGSLRSFQVCVRAAADGSLRIERCNPGEPLPDGAVPATLLPATSREAKQLKKLFGEDD